MPAYRQLMHQVRDAVRLGWIKPGDRLPTVREVVATCAVNQNTVLKAYRELELAGVLEVRQGSGTYVRDSGAPAPAQLPPELRERLEDWVRRAREAGLNDEDMRALLGAVLSGRAGQE
ncbi:GntR family transcriptional regulator [Crossiella sp. CA-258035]|uniref:GntR family transcriptional regulator n=1 Tax=Crossiella sp. CA-258035 TaxID=2981138 RepID=UPI0024BD0C4E|nr:GntR family transcriptional regulator [Crossiella sp. CA-258035]WHT22398.1 GntR family transcriptional regulator [Crossiella sp. CA-258035]